MSSRPHPFPPALPAAVLTAVLATALLGVAAASATPLTVTAVHLSDHAAYVEAVVDYSGATLAGNQVQATKPDPADGAGVLLVTSAGAATRVSVRSGQGVTIRLTAVPSGLRIAISARRGTLKYLSYRVSPKALTVDLWKSTFYAPSGNVARGPGGCLTLGAIRTRPGTVTAAGTARNLFESRFRVVLRNALGVPLASRAVTASGGWKASLHYAAPQGQAGSFEAVALSAKDGAAVCLVQRSITLPASNPRANLRVVYRAGADVNGDGRLDLVSLHQINPMTGSLTVALAGGGRLSARTGAGATWLPGLVASGNVNGRAGEELFVDTGHVTTAESISIYTDWNGALRRAGTLPAYGYDYGILYGLTCSAQGSRHFITEHDFYISVGSHRWMRRDSVYVWAGPALRLFARHPATALRGEPSPALVGVQCGHVPARAPTTHRGLAAGSDRAILPGHVGRGRGLRG